MPAIMNKRNSHLPDYMKRFSQSLANMKIPSRIVFLFLGVVSTIWFLIRVIPKPTRATYPCMQAAYPFMSGFIAYLLGIAATMFAFKKSKKGFMNARYIAAFAFLFISVIAALFTLTTDSTPVYANSKLMLGPNQPVGIARGVFPGRVVWVWDPKSTNENCTNLFGDGWFMEKNTDLTVVNSMLADVVKKLSGKNTIKDSWDTFFKYFNNQHGKGDVGYTEGEKIFIRTNQVSASSGTYNTTTFEILDQKRYGMAETSPQIVLALLRQLVNDYGVKQEFISVGDPMKHMYKHFYDMLHNEFPNVTYLDSDGKVGRTKPISSSRPVIYYSDRGSILKDGGTTGNAVVYDYYPTVITEANYVIIVPAMKAHARAGVTLNGKIHFGSNLRGSATHLHGGLVSPDKVSTRTGYGLYRVQVDLMGHKDLGQKTLLFILDALWGGSEANDPPRKFLMAPFNNDWTSSIMVSQDQVALESVGFDFLKNEFSAGNPFGSYPQMVGSDDHILQAADSTYWPAGFKYDPEGDGTSLPSLGVCEHWNNSTDKQYSRNLKTGNGIELMFIDNSVTSVSGNETVRPVSFDLLQCYPNPFNPSTTIQYQLQNAGNVSLVVTDIHGRIISTLVDGYQNSGKFQYRWEAKDQYSAPVASGIYFVTIRTSEFTKTIKLLFVK